MLSVSKIGYHYEQIVRQDLLLKLDYCNNMQAPSASLLKIIIISQVPSEYVKHVSLALEIICGQKTVQIESSEVRSSKTKKYLAHRLQKGSKQTKYLVKCCLRTEIMYNFLEKLLTLISFHEYSLQLQANVIQLTLGSNLLRLFPETQNHFELFEHLEKMQVLLVTSSKTKEEAGLIWTGLLQKEV